MELRKLDNNDIPDLLRLLDECKDYLIPRDEFTYVVLIRYFPSLCKAIFLEGSLVGYVGGFAAPTCASYLWQLGVSPAKRGKGLATQLLVDFIHESRRLGLGSVEFSVEPENEVALRTFKSFANSEKITMEKMDRVSYEKPDGGRTVCDDFYRYVL